LATRLNLAQPNDLLVHLSPDGDDLHVFDRHEHASAVVELEWSITPLPFDAVPCLLELPLNVEWHDRLGIPLDRRAELCVVDQRDIDPPRTAIAVVDHQRYVLAIGQWPLGQRRRAPFDCQLIGRRLRGLRIAGTNELPSALAEATAAPLVRVRR